MNKWQLWTLWLLFLLCVLVAGLLWHLRFEKLYGHKLFEGPIAPGCILIASQDLSLESQREPQALERVFLINKERKVVHSWQLKLPPFSAKLDANSHLWAIQGMSTDRWQLSLNQYNFFSEPIQQYTGFHSHHDFDFVPEDRMLIIVRDMYKKNDLPLAFLKIGKNWTIDHVQLIDLKGHRTLQRFDLSELVDFSAPVDSEPTPTSLTQINSVRFVSVNPINQRPAILVSARFPSVVAFFDLESGQLIWRSPKGVFDTQHDPSVLPNGDLLVFNNGTGSYVSSVIQYNPSSQQVVWKYQSFDRENFFNHYQGGAQRLQNGNTLVTAGSHGYVFEVDAEGQKVWDWFNTTMEPRHKDAWPYAGVFRAIHYAPEAPEIKPWRKQCQ